LAFAKSNHSLLDHLARVLNPAGSKAKMMLLLTSYADETGHSADPSLHFAGMAGFVGPLDAWKEFEPSWNGILDDFGLKQPFHMKDFAHSEGQFVEWKGDKVRREKLYGKLIGAILETDAVPIGAIVSIEDFKGLSLCQQKSFLDPYYIAFQNVTRGASLEALDLEPPERVAMVYSYNQEFGAVQPGESYSVDQAGRAEQLWHAIKQHTDYGQWMGAYASSTPAEQVQLQAADLFAYELSKEFENLICRPQDKMRWGLRKILSNLTDLRHLRIALLDRAALLGIVKDSRFPCQTGVEENTDFNAVAGRLTMLERMVVRAKVGD